MNNLKRIIENVLQKMLAFSSLAYAYFGVKDWRLSNMIWDALNNII